MAQVVLRVEALPTESPDAASAFYLEWLPRARAALAEGQDLVLVFPPAAHDHRAWRLAAMQGLAREAAPLRVNGLEGGQSEGGGDGLAAMIDWLAGAAAITGQLLAVEEWRESD
jgi:hypothetical protein